MGQFYTAVYIWESTVFRFIEGVNTRKMHEREYWCPRKLFSAFPDTREIHLRPTALLESAWVAIPTVPFNSVNLLHPPSTVRELSVS